MEWGMRRRVLAGLGATLLLAACGQSRLNPRNWFGRSRRAERATAPAPVAEPGDPRQLVAEVTALSVDRTPTGAIVRATGLPPTQGWWEAELVEVETEDEAEAVFDFRISPPQEPYPASTPQSRAVEVATFLTNQRLRAIRRITVQGANSARTAGR
jgi:hypothetical protein